TLVKDISTYDGGWNPGSNPDGFATAGGAVYFGAQERVFGPTFFNVWKTDGTAGGTVKVGSVGSVTNGRFGFTEFGGSVIFCADTPTGRGIYRTEGAGAVLVADGFDTEEFTVFGGKLYFTARTGFDTGVYVMNTATSTPVRAAFDDGATFLSPGWLAAVGNRLYVVGQSATGQNDGSGQLFVTDGTAAGTRVVAIAGGEVPVIYGSGSLTPATGTLYFVAASSTAGQELYRIQTVGGVETAVPVKDIATGTDDAAISGLVFDGARALFIVSGSYQTPADPVLWESDGTAAGTKPVTFVGAGQPTVLTLAKPAGGRLYAAASDSVHGSELWALPIVTAPGTPTGLSVTPGAASAALAWTAPASNGGRTITDYVIQYRRASVATWSTFADAVSPATAATVTGLLGGANYVFRVIARNDVGDGTPSAAVVATIPTPPGAPTGLTAVGGAGQAILTWNAPSSVGSSPITDYVVEFRRASVTTWSVFADGVSTGRTATVTGLIGGANYLFRVTARSAAGDGLPSATAVATILTPPSPPQWISATAGPGTAALAWTLPASQGTSPITDYVVQFRRLSSAVWSTFDDGVSTTRSATVTGLVRGANYAFRIIARSAAGDGAPSGQRSLTIG
ncbi:MAG: fibronectin type III domain-containing protein, partial [Planctomycetes bacterium]|nr:fibronectin type III domain-containing protein [Planctomycetota bacterium]